MNNDKSFIEVQFPVSKVSKESYKERKAGSGQTLTGLGKWWGRKPLVLVRTALLGLLMPASDNPKKDMEIFLKIMSMDKEGLWERRTKPIPVQDVFELLTDREKEQFFQFINDVLVPVWRKEVTAYEKETAFRKVWSRMSYDRKLTYCLRPEEYDNNQPEVWQEINNHLETNASNLQELIEQLGIKKFGRRAVVGDCFCGGGSVPFEAARMGCNVFGSDLNPIAGLLTWASLHIAGADEQKIEELRKFQQKVYDEVDRQILAWGVETNEKDERANSHLYCNETDCPECGYTIPLSPSWIIGKGTRTAAILTDNGKNGFDIDIKSGLTNEEMKQADEMATVRGSSIYCPNPMCKKSVPISALRKDKKEGSGLRLWGKDEYIPRDDDVFRERLYCIRYEYEEEYYDKKRILKKKKKRYYTAPTRDDIEREELVIRLLSERFEEWQNKGFIPDSEIEEGYNTSQLIRERGWKYWHQLFNPRQLLVHGLFMERISELAETKEELVMGLLGVNKMIDFASKHCIWQNGGGTGERSQNTFCNQALNTLFNYGNRSLSFIKDSYLLIVKNIYILACSSITICDAKNITQFCDIWLTDPPYADAVNYHELSEFFLAWDKTLLKKAFPEWYTDSKRVLAVKGRGESFNESMIEIYKNLAVNMPDNGMQIIMFTHQDVNVWADLRNIVWAAGLQVTAAWTIATETESGGLKEGNYVKGTVLLVLRKRVSEKSAFLDEIMPEIEDEVKSQIESMHRLDSLEDPNFNDADYILAAYAASLKVLTSYKRIEDIDVEYDLRKGSINGKTSPVAEVIESAKKIAYDQLIPRDFDSFIWRLLSSEERFYIKGLETEKNGDYRLSSYQELARGYGVNDYKYMMNNTKANAARLKTGNEWGTRSKGGEGFGGSLLRNLFFAIYLAGKGEDNVIAGRNWLKNEVPTYDSGGRKIIIELLKFITSFKDIGNMEHWGKDAEIAEILLALVSSDGI